MTYDKQEKEATSDASTICLAEATIGGTALSRQELIDRCALIDITSWVQQEMGFAESRYRIQVSVTIRVWRALHAMPKEIREFYSVTYRGNDLLWAAASAIRKAREAALKWADFEVSLPTCGCPIETKRFRVTEQESQDGRVAVTIGLADE